MVGTGTSLSRTVLFLKVILPTKSKKKVNHNTPEHRDPKHCNVTCVTVVERLRQIDCTIIWNLDARRGAYIRCVTSCLLQCCYALLGCRISRISIESNHACAACMMRDRDRGPGTGRSRYSSNDRHSAPLAMSACRPMLPVLPAYPCRHVVSGNAAKRLHMDCKCWVACTGCPRLTGWV
jgi:hypothetical protein